MTTDDAPRPALDARAVEEGRRLLARVATDRAYNPSGKWRFRPYRDGLDVGFVDGADGYQVASSWTNSLVVWDESDGRAVVWMMNHAEQLLAAAAERDALAGEVSILRFALLQIGGLAGKHRRAGCTDEDGAIAAIQDAVIEAVESTWSGPALAPAAGAREGAGDGE